MDRETRLRKARALESRIFFLFAPAVFHFVRCYQPGSSEAAVIQAEYAAVDAREKAKLDSEETRRVRAPVRVRLAPATASAGLRMPSEG